MELKRRCKEILMTEIHLMARQRTASSLVSLRGYFTGINRQCYWHDLRPENQQLLHHLAHGMRPPRLVSQPEKYRNYCEWLLYLPPLAISNRYIHRRVLPETLSQADFTAIFLSGPQYRKRRITNIQLDEGDQVWEDQEIAKENMAHRVPQVLPR